MIRKLYQTFQPYTIFVLDAMGASVSIFLIFTILIPYESYIGMPSNILTIFGFIAGLLFFYSNTCFIRKPKHWKRFLLGVIIGNLSYCLLSLFFLATNWNLLTKIGVGYFVIEKIIILSLVSFEYKILRSTES